MCKVLPIFTGKEEDSARSHGKQSQCTSLLTNDNVYNVLGWNWTTPGRVYQETKSTRSGPGGLKETRHAVTDTRAGTKRMAIGHHLGERGHVVERTQDMRNNQIEENQDFINIEEEEADQFEQDWECMARRAAPVHSRPYDPHRPALTYHRQPRQAALPAPPRDETEVEEEAVPSDSSLRATNKSESVRGNESDDFIAPENININIIMVTLIIITDEWSMEKVDVASGKLIWKEKKRKEKLLPLKTLLVTAEFQNEDNRQNIYKYQNSLYSLLSNLSSDPSSIPTSSADETEVSHLPWSAVIDPGAFRKETAKKEEKKKEGPVYCEICNIEVTSRLTYEKHIEGAKHMKKLMTLEKQNMESLGVSKEVAPVSVEALSASHETASDHPSDDLHTLIQEAEEPREVMGRTGLKKNEIFQLSEEIEHQEGREFKLRSFKGPVEPSEEDSQEEAASHSDDQHSSKEQHHTDAAPVDILSFPHLAFLRKLTSYNINSEKDVHLAVSLALPLSKAMLDYVERTQPIETVEAWKGVHERVEKLSRTQWVEGKIQLEPELPLVTQVSSPAVRDALPTPLLPLWQAPLPIVKHGPITSISKLKERPKEEKLKKDKKEKKKKRKSKEKERDRGKEGEKDKGGSASPCNVSTYTLGSVSHPPNLRDVGKVGERPLTPYHLIPPEQTARETQEMYCSDEMPETKVYYESEQSTALNLSHSRNQSPEEYMQDLANSLGKKKLVPS
ncbi:unnamed protein product [Darwinula stevensoni]|uniref:C2H2-type domain-containing protein n=1 Tax=Darwinula stevensoni TaxID=69355 RepID=A0A7R8X9I0_9CRUS|nr:unnamed protein product [Darwinula stevensoni]CAG0889168.1 unnamed protein product [Darwinula stevensoni]